MPTASQNTPVELPSITAGHPVSIYERLVHMGTGELVLASHVDSITVRSYDRANPTTPVGSDSPPAASVVYDTLLTKENSGWKRDEIGANFLLPVPGSFFPNGSVNYQLQVEITLTSQFGGETHPFIYRVRTIPLL